MSSVPPVRRDQRPASRRKAPAVPRLFNADLSWLAYNGRVLERARDASVPLIERLRFLAWCSNNLDEFFMSRVGFIRDQLDAGVVTRTPDGLAPAERLAPIRAHVREHLAAMYDCLDRELMPELAKHEILVESFRSLAESEQSSLHEYFIRQVAPLLTPLALDPGHPFPFVANRALNIAAVVESAAGEHVALMKIPPSLPRFLVLEGGRRFVPIGSLIVGNLPHFFPSLTILRTTLFRFVRNTEIAVDDDAPDLRESIESELRRRERKQVVCIEIDSRVDDGVVELMVRGSGAAGADVYRVPGFLRISDLGEICDRIHDAALHFEPFNPRIPQQLASSEDIFSIIRRGDILLHRPYDSFAPVIELLHAAATDPDVIAVTQTLYQTDEASPIAEKLILAANSGKQVSAVVELQTRFEEKRNLGIARRLQDAGVQVVYGIVGLKTHCKLTLIIRREGSSLRRYLHTSTGNYAVASSRAYTDLDLLTCDEELGAEAAMLVNVLTGFSAATMAEVFEGKDRPHWSRFVVGPVDYQPWVMHTIEREAMHARAGRAARIVAKLNALSDPAIIEALYAASMAGVSIDLIVRGICCLVPGIPGLSDNIRVVSIVDRFLEHSRILQFENGGAREIYLSSGDWMPRNFHSRIELTVPLLDEKAKARVSQQILPLFLADNSSSWDLQSDGTWRRRTSVRGADVEVQKSFIQLARREAVGVGDYQQTIEQTTRYRRKARGRSARERAGPSQ